jgi:hypothetical protein
VVHPNIGCLPVLLFAGKFHAEQARPVAQASSWACLPDLGVGSKLVSSRTEGIGHQGWEEQQYYNTLFVVITQFIIIHFVMAIFIAVIT